MASLLEVLSETAVLFDLEREATAAVVACACHWMPPSHLGE